MSQKWFFIKIMLKIKYYKYWKNFKFFLKDKLLNLYKIANIFINNLNFFSILIIYIIKLYIKIYLN